MIYNIKYYQKDIPLPSEEDKKKLFFFKGKIE